MMAALRTRPGLWFVSVPCAGLHSARAFNDSFVSGGGGGGGGRG